MDPDKKFIIVKGAREHNLKNINVKIPRESFTIITGVSGSGKSSLAFDTIYAEGQRRYVESLSSYARQFLGIMKKPDVDSIEGLSPSISIEQKKLNRNPRSTVGTITEIYDYLRLLYTHRGEIYCFKCGRKIESQTIDNIIERILEYPENTKMIIYAPLERNKKGNFVSLIKNLKKLGYYRVRIDKNVYTLDSEIQINKNKKHDFDLIIDRLILSKEKKRRIFEDIEQAVSLANGKVLIEFIDKNNEIVESKIFSTKFACINCDISYPDIKPSLFSFNSPHGACPECGGLGFKMEFDLDKLFDFNKSIKDGGIKFLNSGENSWLKSIIQGVLKEFNINENIPLRDIPDEKFNILLYGSDIEITINRIEEKYKFYGKRKWEGIIPYLNRRYKETTSDEIREMFEEYMKVRTCPVCNGKRLNKFALSIKINNKDIIELTELSITELYLFIKNLRNSTEKKEYFILKEIFKEIENRLEFLINVGLGYLTLNRMAYTLSGGEAQRIHLATQIGSKLVGVLYVLDEPTIGLHQRDNERLINTLKKLKELGNTLIVVEHDKQTILSSDYVIDLGPGAGRYGGNVVFQGEKSKFLKSDSLTAKYIREEKKICLPDKRRKGNNKFIEIIGATLHNLKNISVKIPLNTFTVITGVSGSGKSSLIIDLIYNELHAYLNYGKLENKGIYYRDIKGIENIKRVFHIDQTPIGRTPRSNPATYTGAFTPIRELFASLKDSKLRGYNKGRFSFNLKGGRCENCRGEGYIKIEMQFLPDIYVECEVCKGKRFNSQTLEVLYKGKNIADVLEMSVDEAYEFFKTHPQIERILKLLKDVGLGYIKLGQPAPTLSGGEAQRIKLTKELSRKAGEGIIYFLDEPTTGLHFDDVARLIKVLQRLVDNGSTVVVIEHNLDIIKSADYIIDLGPEGGNEGGEIIFQGFFEKFLNCKNSYTLKYLLEELK